jgi:DNA-binding IclR family transcriptional regulator
VVAAVSISVPRMVLDTEGLLALVPELLRAAAEASEECGWVPNTHRSDDREDG